MIKCLEDFSERIKNAKVSERKQLLQMMIKNIIYGRKEIMINMFYLPAINKSSKNRSEILPPLDELRNFCYTNKIEIPSLLAA